MNTITQQQALSRWDTLSDNIREAMTSEANSKIVWDTATSEHLSKEKVATVSKLVGFVMMGFIHPEELAGEISAATGIDKRIAAAIAEPINRKIFQPLQEELEKVYAPAAEMELKEKPASFEDIIKPPVKTTASATPSVPVPMTPSLKPTETTQLPKPPAKEAKEPGIIPPIPAPVLKPTPAVPSPATATSAMGMPKSGKPMAVNMFSKLAPETISKPKPQIKTPPADNKFAPAPKAGFPATEKTPAPASVQPEKPAAPESPTPFMLHQESEAQPLSPKTGSFKVGLSEEQFGKMERKWTPSPKPAQVETGFVPPAPKPAGPATRVVHYGDMKTPLPPTPQPKTNSAAPGNPFEVLRKNNGNQT